MRRPEKNPLKTLSASRKLALRTLSRSQANLLNGVLARAEIGLCGYSATISADKDLETDFLVGSKKITLNAKALTDSLTLGLHVRHAIELTLWFQLCGTKLDPVRSLTVALLAALTTTKFYLQLPTAGRKKIEAGIPQWLKESAESAEKLSEKEVLKTLASHLNALLPLQGTASIRTAPLDKALETAFLYRGVANPTELVLTQQGDERLLIDPATGLNKYGCSPRPRPDAITFSSCTASSVSEYAYREAELLRQRLMRTLPRGTLSKQFEMEMESVRSGLRNLLDLGNLPTDIILCSSGTDVELYPLVLLCAPGEKVVNIIVAPDEVGTGTALAAGGRHFSAHSPLGKNLQPGEPVPGIDAELIQVICIPIRKKSGSSVAQKELKQHIASAIAEAAKSADRIILHMVDNTKTGVVAPDADFVLTLKKSFDRKLQVVVDACQFRLEKSNLHRYLGFGFSVLITGSKFFTGPPFCGALLIPDRSQAGRNKKTFPRGFADYFTRAELPPSLQLRGKNLSPILNFGLLFRWAGALNEMRYFYGVSSSQRTEILQKFRSALIDSIAANPDLHLLECPSLHRWQNADLSLWDALPTIFSFAVKDPQSEPKRWLRIRDLKKIYYLLNLDCAGQLPESASAKDKKLAAQKCHIGQPVTISRCATNGETGALRIACGARLVYGITYDTGLGKNPQDRFKRELTDARTVLAKVSLILKYWSKLAPDRPS